MCINCLILFFWCSLDGPGYEADEQYQLFAPAGAILFPTPESEAWKEKVKFLNFNNFFDIFENWGFKVLDLMDLFFDMDADQ